MNRDHLWNWYQRSCRYSDMYQNLDLELGLRWNSYLFFWNKFVSVFLNFIVYLRSSVCAHSGFDVMFTIISLKIVSSSMTILWSSSGCVTVQCYLRWFSIDTIENTNADTKIETHTDTNTITKMNTSIKVPTMTDILKWYERRNMSNNVMQFWYVTDSYQTAISRFNIIFKCNFYSNTKVTLNQIHISLTDYMSPRLVTVFWHAYSIKYWYWYRGWYQYGDQSKHSK